MARTNPYHEAETIKLRARGPLARDALHAYLKKRGFRSIDDFYVLPRHDTIRPWQSEDFVVLDVKRGGDNVYETEEDLLDGIGTSWDTLELKYPMASVPVEYLADFLEHANSIAVHFDLSASYDARDMGMDELGKELRAVAGYLSERWFDPGSENLALLIAMEYPRR